jgi:murein DD-endopeptidase MepM/ murein hydrolase activator NlpD
VPVGELCIRYAHLELVLISGGDQVAPGTMLGLEGSTGFSTSPLHFEVDRHYQMCGTSRGLRRMYSS